MIIIDFIAHFAQAWGGVICTVALIAFALFARNKQGGAK